MPYGMARPSRTVVAALTVLICAALAGCGGPPAEPVAETAQPFDPVAEAQVIMALEREWSRRLAADDVDWIVDLHAADAWQLPPGAEPITGTEALRAAWEGMALTEGLEITWEPTLARVSKSGDMAWDMGSVSITDPDGSKVPAKYLVVWVREGGRWKVAADMFSPNGPGG